MGDDMTTLSRRARAFTLLELVVVLGIVTLATAMLIRTTVKVRARMGEVSCQGNMRQLLSALQMYNNDHNGSMPYGWYYVNSHPVTWQPTGKSEAQVTWVDGLNRYFNTPTGYADAFRCPTALQQAPPHLNSYVMNWIVAVTPYSELLLGQPPRAQMKPPRIHLMLLEGTALIWDTGIRPNWQDQLGHLTGADIDDQRFWQGANSPQFRYYSPHDPYGSIPPGILGNNRPVRLQVGGNNYFNKDPDIVQLERFPYQGNLRFRHDGQTRCNVAFSDGSVRQFTAVVNANNSVASHDALRRYFMIHWPPGVPPNVNVPF
jgi:prepilin-type processing-associated H-X9-DG protein